MYASASSSSSDDDDDGGNNDEEDEVPTVEAQVYWCTYSIFCSVVQTVSAVDLCEYVEAQDKESTECPAAGDYDFETTFTIPTDSSGEAAWVTIVVLFVDADGNTNTSCDATVMYESSAMYSMVSMAGVVVLAGVIWGVRRRRRLTSGRINLEGANEELVRDNVEMKKDPSRRSEGVIV